MKRLILILMLLYTTGHLYSQIPTYPCDPGSNSVSNATAASVSIGDAATFKFVVGNYGTDPSCSIPASDFQFYFSMPQKPDGSPAYFHMINVATTGNYFTWTYDAISNTIIGLNTLGAMPYLGYDSFYVTVLADSVTPSSPVINVGLNIQSFNGVTDRSSNNTYFAPLAVINGTILGEKFGEFDAIADDCAVNLYWESLEETNITHYEVQYLRQSNMSDFKTLIERVDPKGSFQEYQRTVALTSGDYVLRILGHLDDGTAVSSELKHLSVKCNTELPVKIVSNPVVNNKLELTGTLDGDKVQVFDISGKILVSAEGTDAISTIELPEMANGVYVVSVYRNGELKLNEKVRK